MYQQDYDSREYEYPNEYPYRGVDPYANPGRGLGERLAMAAHAIFKIGAFAVLIIVTLITVFLVGEARASTQSRWQYQYGVQCLNETQRQTVETYIPAGEASVKVYLEAHRPCKPFTVFANGHAEADRYPVLFNASPELNHDRIKVTITKLGRVEDPVTVKWSWQVEPIHVGQELE